MKTNIPNLLRVARAANDAGDRSEEEFNMECELRPQTVIQLVEALIECEKTIDSWERYMGGIICGEQCDPAVGYHDPECAIATEMKFTLRSLREKFQFESEGE